MDNLSFDPVKVDTVLAEEYIKKNNKKYVIEEPIGSQKAWDYKNKAVINIKDLSYSCIEPATVPDRNQKLRNLSKKLQDNSELICQLEYLMRKTDVDETRNCHLKLISQQLILEDRRESRPKIIFMEESTPLYYLGYLSTLFHEDHEPLLICEKATAPICQLFYELCSDVGLRISLYGINNIHDVKTWPCCLSLPIMGCTLVITEEADIDSAVDVFLSSSEKAPWRIERIYVQESVYDQLIGALEAKCERDVSGGCVDAFRTAGGRNVECGAGAGAGGDAVPVRAYRGSRELIALLPSGGALSLWCGAAAAAHELALAAPAHLVWIDHYAAFDGPPSASIPLYNHTVDSIKISASEDTSLQELQRKWTALPVDERKAVVLRVLKVYSDPESGEISRILKLVEGIADWIPTTADIVDIASDRITMKIHHLRTETIFINNNMLEALKLAILGYRIAVQYDFATAVIAELYNAGVPIIKWQFSSDSKGQQEITSKLFHTNKKVIHSRFGTIYSN